MISKHVYALMAVLATVIIITPAFASAAYDQVEVIIDAQPTEKDNYDEMVNMADPQRTNADTWSPSYQGIWVGGVTPESLLALDDIVYDGSKLMIGWLATFTSNQIMDGVSEFVVRSPIQHDPAAMTELELNVYVLNQTGAVAVMSGSNDIEMSMPLGGAFQVFHDTYDPAAQESIADDDEFWGRDNRSYQLVQIMLQPGVQYMFTWTATYVADSVMKLYVSPDDVVSDGSIGCNITRMSPSAPGRSYAFVTDDYAVDPGVSFDFRRGAGSGLAGLRLHLEHTAAVEFWLWVNQTGSAFHTLMVPLPFTTGAVNIGVFVYNAAGVLMWSDGGLLEDYNGYIMASSGPGIDLTGPAYLRVRLVMSAEQDLGLVMMSQSQIYGTYDSPSAQQCGYNRTNFIGLDLDGDGDVDRSIGAQLYAVYSLSNHAIAPPTYWPGMGLEENVLHKQTLFDRIMIAFLQGLLLPVELIYYGATGDSLSTYLYNNIKTLAGKVVEAGESIVKWIKSALDAAWDALVAIGEFIWSIGEYIWSALSWLADTLVELGAYLVGILLIPIAMLIFFWPVQYQLKLWSFAWAMADGDLRGAGREANGIIRDSSKAVRTTIRMAGKVDRRVKVASKAYSKWQKSREASREEEGGDEQ